MRHCGVCGTIYPYKGRAMTFEMLMHIIEWQQQIAENPDLLQAYRKALAEEDYETAMHLRDEGGLGLVGWWFASSCNVRGNTPHLLRVSPGYNRLVFEAFTPSELAQEFVSSLNGFSSLPPLSISVLQHSWAVWTCHQSIRHGLHDLMSPGM